MSKVSIKKSGRRKKTGDNQPESSDSSTTTTKSGQSAKSVKGKRKDQSQKTFKNMFGLFRKKKPPSQVRSANSTQANQSKVTVNRQGHPEFVKNFSEFAEKFKDKDSLSFLKTEWNEVKDYKPPMSIIAFNYNKARNAPNASPCLDNSRVGIHYNVPPNSDYINASWITLKGCQLSFRLIIASAPQANTVGDFWRMCWQENVKSVVILANRMENNKIMFQRYWPKAVGATETFEGIQVTYVADNNPGEAVVPRKKLQIWNGNTAEEKREFFLYTYPNWSAGGMPSSWPSLVRLQDNLNYGCQTVVLHASATTGRPGTLAAILAVQRQIRDGKNVTITEIVKNIRNYRPDAVASLTQYVGIYRCLFEYLVQKKVQLIISKQAIENLDDYLGELMMQSSKSIIQTFNSSCAEDNNKTTVTTLMSYAPEVQAQSTVSKLPLQPPSGAEESYEPIVKFNEAPPAFGQPVAQGQATGQGQFHGQVYQNPSQPRIVTPPGANTVLRQPPPSSARPFPNQNPPREEQPRSNPPDDENNGYENIAKFKH